MNAGDELAHYMDATSRLRQRAEVAERERDELRTERDQMERRIGNDFETLIRTRMERDEWKRRAELAGNTRNQLAAERDEWMDREVKAQRELIAAKQALPVGIWDEAGGATGGFKLADAIRLLARKARGE